MELIVKLPSTTMQGEKKNMYVTLGFWNEVFYLSIEEGNYEKRQTPKDHVIEVCNMIGLTSLPTNPCMHNFNFVYPVIEPMNS